MDLLYLLAATAAALELAVYFVPVIWKVRRFLVWPVGVLCIAVSVMLVASRLNVWSVLWVFVACYRLLNLLRVAEGRMHEAYLLRSARRTSLIILGAQLALFVLWLALDDTNKVGYWTWLAIVASQMIVAAVIFASTVRRLKKTRWTKQEADFFADAELPSVTVAIPARNETDDLQQCLLSLISTDYPKLEIIVLDDCSQNRKTPEIIRGFAHQGVRFVQGGECPAFWLPKNFAYKRLAEEAAGDIIVFCGVDIRFSPDSLRKIVSAMKIKNKSMMSILPLRAQSARAVFSPLQAMRYWWELSLPRRMFRRPPVIGSFWVIERSLLKSCGGFDAVARSIVPEAFFARCTSQTDTYSFMRADGSLGVESVKTVAEQRDTAVRMRYPQMHKRPENVMGLTLAQSIFGLAPFFVLLTPLWLHIDRMVWVCSAATVALTTVSYALASYKTRVNNVFWAVFSALPAFVLDLAVLHVSMWQYEFGTVTWRSRNICVPAMHVFPRLPEAD